MKNIFKILAFLSIGGLIFSSCDDDYSEEDALTALQYITLQIGVHDASNSYAAVQGAEVRAVINAESVTATTDTNGIAVFENVQIGGYVNVYVSKDDYTTVYSQVNTTPADYRQTAVSGDVYVYSTSGSNIATVKGQLTIETDLTNREREYVSGVEVLAYNGNLSNTTNYFVDSTDSEGNYSINVPVNSTGDDYIYVYFPNVETERTFGKVTDNVYSLVTEPYSYYPSSYGADAIDKVPSALVQIAAPPASGSNFELGLVAIKNSLSDAVDNESYEAAIVSGGSGYTAGQTFTFEADEDGNKAEIYISSVNDGVIDNVYFNDNGAKYSSMPAIESSPADGSGAEFDFRFRYQYKVYISNYGSGYLSFPQVGLEYTTTVDNTSKLQAQYAVDIDSSNPIGALLYDNAFISDGSIIVTDETDGDTLFTTSYVYSEPVFSYSDEDREQAEYYANYSGISTTTGALSDNFTSNSQGDGYDYSTPPTVTITALAGYGSGASVKAVVNTNGNVTDLVVMAEGSGYVQDINDYDGDDTSEEEEDATMYGFYSWTSGYGYHRYAKPGMTYTGNIFYGTGIANE